MDNNKDYEGLPKKSGVSRRNFLKAAAAFIGSVATTSIPARESSRADEVSNTSELWVDRLFTDDTSPEHQKEIATELFSQFGSSMTRFSFETNNGRFNFKFEDLTSGGSSGETSSSPRLERNTAINLVSFNKNVNTGDRIAVELILDHALESRNNPIADILRNHFELNPQDYVHKFTVSRSTWDEVLSDVDEWQSAWQKLEVIGISSVEATVRKNVSLDTEFIEKETDKIHSLPLTHNSIRGDQDRTQQVANTPGFESSLAQFYTYNTNYDGPYSKVAGSLTFLQRGIRYPQTIFYEWSSSDMYNKLETTSGEQWLQVDSGKYDSRNLKVNCKDLLKETVRSMISRPVVITEQA